MRDPIRWIEADKSIHKWKSEYLYTASGLDQIYIKELERFIEIIRPFYPSDMANDYNAKHLMIFSNNIERDFNAVEGKMDRATSKGHSRKIFNKIKNSYKGCFSIKISNKETEDIYAILTMVDANSDYDRSCVPLSIYSSLGFIGFEKSQPFSFLSKKESQISNPTKLDIFLIYLLYQKDFNLFNYLY